jgi:hypothetical protein
MVRANVVVGSCWQLVLCFAAEREGVVHAKSTTWHHTCFTVLHFILHFISAQKHA